jgi:hypothetical protein
MDMARERWSNVSGRRASSGRSRAAARCDGAVSDRSDTQCRMTGLSAKKKKEIASIGPGQSGKHGVL